MTGIVKVRGRPALASPEQSGLFETRAGMESRPCRLIQSKDEGDDTRNPDGDVA